MSRRGQMVRTLREAMGLSEQEFAKALGVYWRTIYRWEREGVEPSPLAMQRITALREQHENPRNGHGSGTNGSSGERPAMAQVPPGAEPTGPRRLRPEMIEDTATAPASSPAGIGAHPLSSRIPET